LNKIERAEKANRILNDEIFKESFESVRQALLQKFEAAPVGDADGIMKVRLCLKLLTDVRANLEAVLRDGKVEEFNIQEKKRLSIFRR
jgi:hypothetical protein